jgi:zinc transport system ATP-binding protein
MLGLQALDHGRVHLFGEGVDEFTHWGRVALVPQSLPVTASVPISVWEMVLAGLASPRSRLRRLSRAQRQMIESALATVGLSEKAKSRLDTLSGGQQRRALIARALAQQPDLLVLDEPGAGLDAENLEILVATLSDLHRRGITIIAITHDLHELGPLVGRAVVLGAGKDTSIRYDGPPPVPEHFDEHSHHHVESGTNPSLLGGDA